VETSRKHGPFDMRWPCARNNVLGAVPDAYAAYKETREWRTPPAQLRLVPPEHTADADEQEREEAGTRRLMAAMAAAHPREAQGRLPR
jgi:hypothetical protein